MKNYKNIWKIGSKKFAPLTILILTKHRYDLNPFYYVSINISSGRIIGVLKLLYL